MNQTRVMDFVAKGQLKKNPRFFQIESRFCRELETTLWKSPAIGVHLFFLKMGINHLELAQVIRFVD